jgi:hypothetical protein
MIIIPTITPPQNLPIAPASSVPSPAFWHPLRLAGSLRLYVTFDEVHRKRAASDLEKTLGHALLNLHYSMNRSAPATPIRFHLKCRHYCASHNENLGRKILSTVSF